MSDFLIGNANMSRRIVTAKQVNESFVIGPGPLNPRISLDDNRLSGE